MLHVDFEEANLTLGKPKEMTDNECSSLRVLRTKALGEPDEHGVRKEFTQFYSHWMPSKEDMEAFQAGRGMWLCITSEIHPVVGIFTTDEWGGY